jgi:hypothetical protein
VDLNTTKEKMTNGKIKQQKQMFEIWTTILLKKEGKNQVTETQKTKKKQKKRILDVNTAKGKARKW